MDSKAGNGSRRLSETCPTNAKLGRYMASLLCGSILAKIHEQIERAAHLVLLLPPERLDWTPSVRDSWSTARVLGHLLECLAGFCAVLAAVNPERLAHFSRLREMPVNHACSSAEAINRIALYRSHIDEGFAWLTDADLARLVRTVFVKDGEPVVTLLLGNLEHLINHKHQLFTYLKLMGVEVGTRDLYCFRPMS
jgi:DinB family protein